MSKRKNILSLLLVFLLVFAFIGGNVGSSKVSAYTLENGEKRYSITADRYVYQTENYVDKTINTFEAWIKLPKLADGVVGGVIFGNYFNVPYGHSGCIDFGVGRNGKFHLYWNNGAYVKTFETVDLRNDTWTHVAIVRDKVNSTLTYLVNGAVAETVNVALPESVSTDMRYCVGSNWNNWYKNKFDETTKQPFYGEIRQVSIYSETLSNETIAQDMNKQVKVTSQANGLMGNWYFGDTWAVEKVVKDSSIIGNDCERITFDKYVPVEEVTDFDYTFIVVPDQQAMSYHKPDNFRQQSQWIVDSKQELNTQFVMYLGDMVEHMYDNESQKAQTEKEWQLVQECYYMLDGKVPYSFILGNHDYDNWARNNRNVTMFHKYLPYEHYSSMDNFGGAFEEGKLDNYYVKYKIGDVEWMVFNLEYGPRYNVMNWVDRIVSENPKSRVIINTHSYVNPNGRRQNRTDVHSPCINITYGLGALSAQDMWERVISKHANICMVFSGHQCSDFIVQRQDVGVNGNVVNEFLIDVQGAMFTSAMNTVLLVKVNEAKKTMSLCYYSPEYDACYNEQSQYTFSFADANNPAVGLATESAEPLLDSNQSSQAVSTVKMASGIGVGSMLVVGCLISVKKRKGDSQYEI